MRHSKGFYTSREPDEVIGDLYEEIEDLEERVDDLEDRLDIFESEIEKLKR